MASRKVYYIRSNPDPKPAMIVYDPERITKKKKKKKLEDEISLKRVISLPSELESLQDIDFDLKFEHSLFKSKSENDLKTVVLDPDFISFLNAKQKSIAVNSKFKKAEYQTKVEEINVTILKDIDEAIELAHLLTYAKKPSVSQLHTTIIPSRDSFLYVVTSFINSTTSSSTDPFIPKLPDPGGYLWSPTYSTWGPTIFSFSFSVSAQLTIFSSFLGPEFPEPF